MRIVPPRLRNTRGASAMEYIIMLLLAAMFILAIIRIFGDTIKQKFGAANDELSGTLAAKDSQPAGSKGSAGGGSGDGLFAGSSGSGGAGSAGAGGKSSSGDGKGGAGGGGAGAGAGGKGGAGPGGGGSGESDGSGAGGGGPDEEDSIDGASGQGGGEKGEGGKRAGINPLILLVAAGLVGLLLYVMGGKKKG